MADNANKEGVTLTEFDLQFKVLTKGDGPIPSRQDLVRAYYTGHLLDSTVFNSSVEWR